MHRTDTNIQLTFEKGKINIVHLFHRNKYHALAYYYLIFSESGNPECILKAVIDDNIVLLDLQLI